MRILEFKREILEFWNLVDNFGQLRTPRLSPAVIDSDSKQSLQEEEERPREAKAQDYLCS